MDEAIACYKKAIELDPKPASAHNNLGAALATKGRPDEAIACYKKAIELDPKYAAAHSNLGDQLRGKGQLDEAIASYRKAIELDPKLASAHNGLGVALAAKGQPEEAIACYKKAIELDSKLAWAHNNLGLALATKGHLDEAIACFKKAIELDPKLASAHGNLGFALADKGHLDEAIACYKKAIELDPKLAGTHANLGLALATNGHLDEAMACWRKAIELDPKLASAHGNLGAALKDKGQLDEAITFYKKAIELDPNFALARTQLASARRMAAARDKWPAFQNGSYTPTSNEERLGLIGWCQIKKLNHGAAGLYAAAFVAAPELADDLKAFNRYNAACYAALAAAGQGEDSANLDDKERTRLRKQALDWLCADLALRTRQLQSANPADRAAAQESLRHWQQDFDLAGIRNVDVLAKLPEAEQKACQALWKEVESLLNGQATSKAKNAEANRTESSKEGVPPAEPKPPVRRPEPPRSANTKPDKVPDDMAKIEGIHQRAHELAPTKPGEAEPLFRQALEGYRKMQGPDGAVTLDLMNDLAGLLSQSGRHAEAEPLSRAAIKGARKRFGAENPRTAGVLATLSLSLIQQSKWTEAEPLLRECLAIRVKTQPDVWSTFNTKSLLGGVLLGQKKYAEAEPLLLAGCEGLIQREKTIPQQGKIRLPEAVERLVQLYEATGKKDEAARWKAERAKHSDDPPLSNDKK